MPVGEGSLKKSLELLKKKLTEEGLFAPEKKRPLPAEIQRIGVISSTQAAGYADFCKILNERWGGLTVITAHTQVQGMVAADQMIRALNYFNERGGVDVIAIIRGGGSADDLAVFNDENLVRAIAASKIPVITGIGHEVDESLCDLAADVVASTPSNAAQMLSKDKKQVTQEIRDSLMRVQNLYLGKLDDMMAENRESLAGVAREIVVKITTSENEVAGLKRNLEGLNPERVLEQGYALMRGELKAGADIEIETTKQRATATVKTVKNKE